MIVMITLNDTFKDIWECDGEALFSSKYPKQLFVFKDRYLNSLPVRALGVYRGSLSARSISLLEITGICRKVPEKGDFDISLLFRFLRKLSVTSEDLLVHLGEKVNRLLCEIPYPEIKAIHPDIFR